MPFGKIALPLKNAEELKIMDRGLNVNSVLGILGQTFKFKLEILAVDKSHI